MTAAFLLLTIGGIMVVSSLRGISIVDTLRGEFGNTLDPSGGKAEVSSSATASPGSSGGRVEASAVGGAPSGSPKAIIDSRVIPVAARILGTNITPETVAAANARHSVSTTSGNRSDHKGPPDVSWAADVSNGTKPTPEMDLLAKTLASNFGIPWSGSGLVSKTIGSYRYQLIYRTMAGGNHFNHVHFGIKKVK